MPDNENESVGANPPAGDPVEEIAVTGRPVDKPLPNTTFAERAKARSKAVQGEGAENKAVSSSERKRKRK